MSVILCFTAIANNTHVFYVLYRIAELDDDATGPIPASHSWHLGLHRYCWPFKVPDIIVVVIYGVRIVSVSSHLDELFIVLHMTAYLA